MWSMGASMLTLVASLAIVVCGVLISSSWSKMS
jgi:hypothetical protein